MIKTYKLYKDEKSAEHWNYNLFYLVFFILILNFISFYFGIFQILWTQSLFILAILFIFIIINTRIFELGFICWPNIFLMLLSLFHFGYYIPLQLGLIERIPFLPDLDHPLIGIGMTIIMGAVISFELGALAGIRVSHKKISRKFIFLTSNKSRAIFILGLIITIASFVLMIIFAFQAGGIKNFFTMSYADYISLVSYADPRAAAMSLSYLPIGLLLLYIDASARKPKKKVYYFSTLIAIIILILWLLWLGNRGIALLLFLCLLYIHHLRVKRIKLMQAIAFFVLILVSIFIVREIRNIPVSERKNILESLKIDLMEPFIEMGGIIRPYLGCVEIFSSNKSNYLWGKSYIIAISRVLPNIGFNVRQINDLEYYRTNIWITQELDPTSAKLGIGLGSSGIAEPYMNFGYPGVVIIFFALGYILALIERRAVLYNSAYFTSILVFLFFPINWYLRDDAYGTLRPMIWGLLSVFIFYFIFDGHFKNIKSSRSKYNENLYSRRDI